MFQVLPKQSYSFRVGPIPSRARHAVDSPEQLCDLLEELARSGE